MSKLVRFPKTTTTPELLLHQLLEHASQMKALSVVIEWEDESMDTHWSKTKATKLCAAGSLLQHEAMEMLLS